MGAAVKLMAPGDDDDDSTHPPPNHVTRNTKSQYPLYSCAGKSCFYPSGQSIAFEISENGYAEIERLFTKNRTTLPLMFIATPDDKHNSTWTKRKPTALILQRLAVLAAASADLLEKQLNDCSTETDFKVQDGNMDQIGLEQAGI